ncbi:S8 family serine peptidase [Arthrobacter sp. MMS24-S77]
MPTGNLPEWQFRPDWPNHADQALAMLANYRYAGLDRMHQPADSLRAVVVSALDPRKSSSSPLVPSVYSRRGPGLALGSKPDLCHLGGSADPANHLRSLGLRGEVVGGCGTSYAAPLVAKTLGQIDHKIAGKVKRETLAALAIHGAEIPAHMAHQKLAHVAKDFVGFGLPQASENTLVTDDHSITLVFEAQLKNRKALTFDFQWPQALVHAGGKCAGAAKLTLVYRPPLDLGYGSETVRVNLEAYLRQEKVDRATGELSYEGFFKSKAGSGLERERVKEGQKWGAVKKWSRTTSKAGVGNSSQFRLVVEPLARSGFALPAEGIPFAAILTISDPWGRAPVFNQLRRSLQARDVVMADIRTAAQIRPRTGF